MYRLLTYHGQNWLNEWRDMLAVFFPILGHLPMLPSLLIYLLLINIFLNFFSRLSRSTANHRLNWSERISFASWWAQLFNFFFLNIQRRIVSTLRTDLILKSTTCLGEIFIEKKSADRWLSERNFFPMPIDEELLLYHTSFLFSLLVLLTIKYLFFSIVSQALSFE